MSAGMRKLKKLVRGISAALMLGVVAGCGGGGGGGGGGSSKSTLLSISFPDPNDVNRNIPTTQPPTKAPLNQQIVFNFDQAPSPAQIHGDNLQILDASGFVVAGNFEVQLNKVVFTPELPVTPLARPGFQPGAQYRIRIDPNSWRSVSIAPALQASFPDTNLTGALSMLFQTTTIEDRYFRGLVSRSPRLVSTDPVDGEINVSPDLYSDPDGVFPERRSLLCVFDGPIKPAEANLTRFRLIDLDDRPAMFPGGLPLGIDVRVLLNEVDRSVVEVSPSGILPLGHMLSLEYPEIVRGLAQLGDDPGEDTVIATTFTTSEDPGGPIVDLLVEDFDTKNRLENDVSEIEAFTAAQWDFADSGVLQPGSFAGTGRLGRFLPVAPDDPAEPNIVIVDTTRQVFPFLDGSTPDAAAGTVAVGGVFDFTDIDIPEGVIIRPIGPNPLQLIATGTVRIAGIIDLQGQHGSDENAFDSATTALPGGLGGPGGGRGGAGQPIIWSGVPGLSPLVSPPRGGRGWGPRDLQQIGGQGGECGMLDNPDEFGQYGTDFELDTAQENVNPGWSIGNVPEPCGELITPHSNGYKPPGGGGGSHVKEGSRNLDGVGNVRTDGFGNYMVTRRVDFPATWNVLLSGTPGARPFADGSDSNDFIGTLGEFQSLLGGQGGGAGGSALDSYYCGKWCLNDATTINDNLCVDEGSYPTNPIVDDPEGDARGGSGGGGGGAFSLRALGEIVIESTGLINCAGGNGGAGEGVGCGSWAGSGGGGSGGAIVIQSATDVIVQAGAVVTAAGGAGGFASERRGGNTHEEHRSLAFDTETGVCYAINKPNNNSSRLFTVDKTHALGLEVMSLDIGTAGSGNGLAYNPNDGLLYHASGNDVFQKINPTTRAVTDIPMNFGFTFLGISVSALCYVPEQDFFYWAQDTTQDLYRMTPDGSETYLSTLDHVARGLALVDGELWSITDDDKKLRRIDPATGATLFETEDIDHRDLNVNASAGHGLAVEPESGELWALLFMSNQQVLTGRELVRLDTETGFADSIGVGYSYINTGSQCRGFRAKRVGAGGAGGDGLVQIQLKGGQRADVDNEDDSILGFWHDPDNLVNPAEFTSVSAAQSKWFDLGRAIDRNGNNGKPEYQFRGLSTDPGTLGQVITDADGFVANPTTTDIRVDFLGVLQNPDVPGVYEPGLEPRANYIPPNATVIVQFQGAEAIAEGSKEVDPNSLTAWDSDISFADGMQFVRYRVIFNITADASELRPDTPRPTVQSVRIQAEF